MALFNAITELIGMITLIVIVSNQNIIHPGFNTYMAETFSVTAEQTRAWGVSGVIVIFLIYAVISVVDGFRKSKTT
ncbi:hypothetical protein [Aneurinibacillus sp. REN35]|uniref:hypothetical protein n=1 Tax=Aneurinibacillus sp. REN35 TaxID=3237286 RepID=UPI003527994D